MTPRVAQYGPFATNNRFDGEGFPTHVLRANNECGTTARTSPHRRRNARMPTRNAKPFGRSAKGIEVQPVKIDTAPEKLVNSKMIQSSRPLFRRTIGGLVRRTSTGRWGLIRNQHRPSGHRDAVAKEVVSLTVNFCEQQPRSVTQPRYASPKPTAKTQRGSRP